MYRVFKLVSSILLIGIVATLLTACNTLASSKKENENSNSLAKIVEIELGDKGNCSIHWNDQNGSETVETLPETTRFLFKTKKNEIYREVTFSMTAKFSEEDELTHLIVVFQKGHKLTLDEKSIIEKFGINYMFEK